LRQIEELEVQQKIGDFIIEDDLLYWQGYFISPSFSELTLHQLHLIQSICLELVEMEMNPEEYFSSPDVYSSSWNLILALKSLKKNSLN
jgi:hypothetical protein